MATAQQRQPRLWLLKALFELATDFCRSIFSDDEAWPCSEESVKEVGVHDTHRQLYYSGIFDGDKIKRGHFHVTVGKMENISAADCHCELWTIVEPEELYIAVHTCERTLSASKTIRFVDAGNRKVWSNSVREQSCCDMYQ